MSFIFKCCKYYGTEVIYKALCFDVAQGRMNGAPNETRTHSCRSTSLARGAPLWDRGSTF